LGSSFRRYSRILVDSTSPPSEKAAPNPMLFAHPKKLKKWRPSLSREFAAVRQELDGHLDFQDRIIEFHRIWDRNASTRTTPLLARLPCPDIVADHYIEEQNGTEEEGSFSAEVDAPDAQDNFVTETDSDSQSEPLRPALVYYAFSAFLEVKWSHLGIQDWAMFIKSRFFTIVYATLIQPEIAEGEVDDLLAALVQPLQFLSCEGWVTTSERFGERTLTREILGAILSFEPTLDLLSLLSSLIRLTREAAFAEHVFLAIRDWLGDVFENALSPGDVDDRIWFFLRTLASAPFPSFFEWFCGDFDSLSGLPDSPSDDLEWPSGDGEFPGDTKSFQPDFQEFHVSTEGSFLLRCRHML
jgi:hypothetical protein